MGADRENLCGNLRHLWTCSVLLSRSRFLATELASSLSVMICGCDWRHTSDRDRGGSGCLLIMSAAPMIF
jgi:hypothetical protein